MPGYEFRLPSYPSTAFPSLTTAHVGSIARDLTLGGIRMFSGTDWVHEAGEVVNVKEFGAIGDGTSHPLSERYATLAAAQAVYPHAVALTDEIDWAAIQAALNVGSPSVLIPDGTYLISASLAVPANSHIYGFGRKSLLQVKAGIVLSPLVLSGVSNVDIHHIAIDGNKVTQTNRDQSGIYVEHLSASSNINLHHLHIREMSGYGIRSNGSAYVDYLRVEKCFIETSFDVGIYFNQATRNSTIRGNLLRDNLNGIYVGIAAAPSLHVAIEGNIIDSPRRMGIECQGLTPESGLVVSGNVIHDAGSFGISIANCPGAVVVGNRIKNAIDYGIEFIAPGGVCADNAIDGVVKSAGGSSAVGVIVNTSSRSSISNCVVGGLSGTPSYGIELIDSDDTSVMGCVVNGADEGIRSVTNSVGLSLSGNVLRAQGLNGILLDADSVAISGCIVTNPGSNGMTLNGCNNVAVSGNVIRHLAGGAANGDGIELGLASTNVVIIGNRIGGFTGTPGSGISVSSATDTLIVANNLRNNTAAITDTGTGTIQFQNIGAITNTLAGRLDQADFITFADADITPSVSGGNMFKTANTGATSITTFDDGVNGQEIVIVFGDANTTLTNGTLKLSGAANFVSTADDTMKLVYDGTAWREISRSVN